mmetsp:Transcript_8654/g.15791  ORF Transcript_8654/g.15791 Transcript_8654/m.15791 type:complete len:202 (-) Transcript_8654:76-681(-)
MAALAMALNFGLEDSTDWMVSRPKSLATAPVALSSSRGSLLATTKTATNTIEPIIQLAFVNTNTNAETTLAAAKEIFHGEDVTAVRRGRSLLLEDDKEDEGDKASSSSSSKSTRSTRFQSIFALALARTSFSSSLKSEEETLGLLEFKTIDPLFLLRSCTCILRDRRNASVRQHHWQFHSRRVFRNARIPCFMVSVPSPAG